MTPAHATILSDTERSVPKLPELLCPVGSPFALDAAIEGGADALYLGGSAFNARMNAANFDQEQLKDVQPPHFCSTLYGGSSQEVRQEQGIRLD